MNAQKYPKPFKNNHMHKILVADDNAEILKVMEIVLKTNHYDVILESDGNKIVKKVLDSLPNLIIMDVNIGTVNGIDICKEIRLIDKIKKIPIIIFSANAHITGIINSCGDDFLIKGFSIDELLFKIDTLLSKIIK